MKSAAVVALIVATMASSTTFNPRYRVATTIAGADGGWDYASVDVEANKLYVARADSIMVVDLASGKVINKLASAQRAHSVLPIPGSGALLETDGATNRVRLIDEQTGAERWSLNVGKKPDAAIWDARSKRAIVMNSEDGTIALVDTTLGKITGIVRAHLGLEGATFDKRGLLWVSTEDSNSIIPIDLTTMKALSPLKLSKCVGPTGVVYASRLDQLVSVCYNGVASIINARSRRQVASFAIGKGADTAMVDEHRSIIAVPCGESGVLEVLSTSGAHISRVLTVPTAKSARTGALNPVTGRIYLPSARFSVDSNAVSLAAAKAAGSLRKLVPGSFRVIVVSPT